jgi:hypothetical protein
MGTKVPDQYYLSAGNIVEKKIKERENISGN